MLENSLSHIYLRLSGSRICRHALACGDCRRLILSCWVGDPSISGLVLGAATVSGCPNQNKHADGKMWVADLVRHEEGEESGKAATPIARHIRGRSGMPRAPTTLYCCYRRVSLANTQLHMAACQTNSRTKNQHKPRPQSPHSGNQHGT